MRFVDGIRRNAAYLAQEQDDLEARGKETFGNMLANPT
jgi:hypothetical protein